MENHTTIAQWIGNISGAGAIIAAMVGWLPAAGALVAMIWYMIQIRESDTYKKWALKRHMKRVARLEAKLAYLRSLERYENS